MKQGPAISVIIPVFNGAPYLREAIESAFAQTLPPVEVVVLDDGSTDASPEIAKSLPVVYVRQENQGLSAARNAAIEQAQGDWFALLDCDDVWLPHKLEAQMDVLQRNSFADYALCKINYLFPASGPPAWFHRNGPDEGELGFSPSCWLFSLATWERVGPFNPELRTAEDIDWLARANDLGLRSAMVPEVLVLKRVHERNMTSNVEAIKRGWLDALRPSIARKRALHRS